MERLAVEVHGSTKASDASSVLARLNIEVPRRLPGSVARPQVRFAKDHEVIEALMAN